MKRILVFAVFLFAAVLVFAPFVNLDGAGPLSGLAFAGVLPLGRALKRRRAFDWGELDRFTEPETKFRRANRMISGVTLPSSWEAYNTQDNGFELVHNPLWYTRTYVDNVTTTLNFFDQPLATDDLATNVFPYQNSYLLKALGIYILQNIQTDDQGAPAVAVASGIGDVQLLINTAVLDFKIGKKDYGPFPCWRLASGGGVWGVATTGGAEAANVMSNFGQIGMPAPDNIYKLAIPVVIPAQTNCLWRLRWPAGAVDLVLGRAIKLVLEGIEARPRQ